MSNANKTNLDPSKVVESPKPEILFYLDPLGREMAEIPSFKGRKKFKFDDPVIRAFLLRLLMKKAAEDGCRVTGTALKLFIESFRPICHEVGMREEAGDWLEVELEKNSLLEALHIKAQQISAAVVKSTQKWQKLLVTLAKKEGIDSTAWSKVQPNVFSRLMRKSMEPLHELKTKLEKLKPNKLGSRWRLWPAGNLEVGVSKLSPPLSPPSSPPPNTITASHLGKMVALDVGVNGIIRYLEEKNWKNLLDSDRGEGCRHVLLSGGLEKTGPLAKVLLDRGKEFKYLTFTGKELTLGAVEQVQKDLEGYPERILVQMQGLEKIQTGEQKGLLALLNWAQATCVCTIEDRAMLTEHLDLRFSFWLELE